RPGQQRGGDGVRVEPDVDEKVPGRGREQRERARSERPSTAETEGTRQRGHPQGAEDHGAEGHHASGGHEVDAGDVEPRDQVDRRDRISGGWRHAAALIGEPERYGGEGTGHPVGEGERVRPVAPLERPREQIRGKEPAESGVGSRAPEPPERVRGSPHAPRLIRTNTQRPTPTTNSAQETRSTRRAP